MGLGSFLRSCREAVEGGLVTDPKIDDDGVVRSVPMMDGRSSNFAAGYSPDIWARRADDTRTEAERRDDLGRILRIMNEPDYRDPQTRT